MIRQIKCSPALWMRALTAFALMVTLTIGGSVITTQALPTAAAAPCPDLTQPPTCGPQPTQDPGPTQQPTQGIPTTVPQAPQTTIPPNTDTGLPTTPPTGPGFQGTVQSMPTVDPTGDGCIVNCPTQQPAPIVTQAPTTAQPPTQATGPPQSRGIDRTTTSSDERCTLAGRTTLNVRAATSLKDELGSAIRDWNATGAANVSSRGGGGGGADDVIVSDTFDTRSPYQAVYYPSANGAPARIVVNRAQVDGESPSVVQALLAHELGHALGLSDVSGGDSLMATVNNGSAPKADDLAALSAARQRCAVRSDPEHAPFCSDPNTCDLDIPMEALMESCESSSYMRDDEFVGRWGGSYFLRCGEYSHIVREHFQSEVTVRDRTDFRGCVGLTLALGKDYVEANDKGLEWTNPATGVTAKIPLGVDPKYGNTIIRSAYAGNDGKDWGGCVRGTVAEGGNPGN